MSYAALFLPGFRLQAVLRGAPEAHHVPVALVDSTGTKPRIAEAWAPQVEVGMTVTQATARCPGLQLKAPDVGQETSAQEILLQAAQGLSPFVESTGPGIATVELPPEKHFTETDFEERIVGPLKRLGFRVRVGVADNADLALLAARYADPVRIVTEPESFLQDLPTAALDPEPDLLSVLDGWGIRTIGELTELPMTKVCERLGSRALQLWQRARGGQPRPLKIVKIPEAFEEKTDLEYPIETLEPLLFLLKDFLERLSCRLEQVYRVMARLRLVLRFDDGTTYEKCFAIPSPTRNVALLCRMLQTHLENFTASSPIVGLELKATPALPSSEQSGLLERGLKDPNQFADTLARLQALVGADRVGVPHVEDSHRPDAVTVEPYVEKPMLPTATPLTGLPLFRFRPPLAATVRTEAEKPSYIASPRFQGRVSEALGPWKMRGNWWDLLAWAREEWDVATENGFYRLARIGKHWVIEGIYG